MNRVGDLTLGQTSLLLIVAAGTGGLTGYLICDALLYRMIKNDLDRGDPGQFQLEFPEETTSIYTPPEKGKVPYEKMAHARLVREEGYIPPEPEEAIRIVPKDYLAEASELMEQVIYYADDGVYVIEDTREKVEDPNNLFIPNTHLHFGEETQGILSPEGDPDVVYILNANVGLVYEIIRVSGSYSSEILGEPSEKAKSAKDDKDEEKVEKKPKRSRRAAKTSTPAKPNLEDLVEELSDDDGESGG